MGDYLLLAQSSLDLIIRESKFGDHTVAQGDLQVISLYAAIAQAEQTKRLADAQERANGWNAQIFGALDVIGIAMKRLAAANEEVVEDICGKMVDEMAKGFTMNQETSVGTWHGPCSLDDTQVQVLLGWAGVQ